LNTNQNALEYFEQNEYEKALKLFKCAGKNLEISNRLIILLRCIYTRKKTMPEGQLFVMGDNRRHSRDSRKIHGNKFYLVYYANWRLWDVRFKKSID
jgi:hypothetical protein